MMPGFGVQHRSEWAFSFARNGRSGWAGLRTEYAAQEHRVCFLDMAVRYRAQRGSMVALHPWMRDLGPYAVQLALERL